MTEYLRHLSKVHFKQKLLAAVPSAAPYKCPADGCNVAKKDRWAPFLFGLKTLKRNYFIENWMGDSYSNKGEEFDP
jgi:hypothetical protein